MASLGSSYPLGSYMKGKSFSESQVLPVTLFHRAGERLRNMSVCHFEVCLINGAGGGYSSGNNKTLFTFQKCKVLFFVSGKGIKLKKRMVRKRRGREALEEEQLWEKK